MSLTPHPGSKWANLPGKNYIIPDFVVETDYEEITAVELNSGDVPVLRLNRDWVNRLRDYSANKLNQTAAMRDDVVYYKQKIEAAQGFIDAVRRRQDTLLRTMKTIVQLQREFFLTGDESKLRPMILQDVAVPAGYDASTISRASAGKYVETPFGVYALKHFFSESTQTESGESVSAHKIRHIITAEIEAENKQQPVTDDELTAILNAKGFIIARRTVAKYRERLGIPIARMRKEV
jgi:RNA polymerase sigma-54 factor